MPPPSNPAKEALRCALLITEPGASGTGVPIGIDADGSLLILTCRHVVDETGTGWVGVTIRGIERPGFVTALHPVLDAALVRVDISGMDPVRLRRDRPEPGERVWVAGYALRDFFLVGEASLTGSVVSWMGAPGISGGPVLDREGRLVGICAEIAFWHQAWPIGVMVPVQDLREWLTSCGARLR